MPNRILKDSICTSETIEGLTDAEEVFFYRLLVQCDDYGRFDARPAVIRARLYPMRIDQVSEADVLARLEALVAAGLILLYQVEGRAYLQVTTWETHQQVRAKNSKFPPMPAGARDGLPPSRACQQMISDASTCTREARSEKREDDTREASSVTPEEARVGPHEAAAAAGGGDDALGTAEYAGEPVVGRFVREVWAPAFPAAPLLCSTLTGQALADFERAILQHARAPAGVEGLLEEMRRRLLGGGYRERVLAKMAGQWHAKVLGYLTQTVRGIWEDGHDAQSGAVRGGAGAGGGRVGPRGHIGPAAADDYVGVVGGVHGVDEALRAALVGGDRGPGDHGGVRGSGGGGG
jgi:hypothetical protein